VAVPASAANIVLIDSTNSFATAPNGAEALFAFQKAANYWNKTLANDATIRIDIKFASLGAGILGSTGSNSNVVSVADVYTGLKTTGNSALDQIAVAHLPTLANGTDLAMRVNAYTNAASKIGVDPTLASRISNGSNGINQYLDVNTAVLKAMGMSATYDSSYAARKTDASITFSSNFAFDFNPTDGIASGKYDFTAVAVHELGHALGFVSGVTPSTWLAAKVLTLRNSAAAHSAPRTSMTGRSAARWICSAMVRALMAVHATCNGAPTRLPSSRSTVARASSTCQTLHRKLPSSRPAATTATASKLRTGLTTRPCWIWAVTAT
jgi:hypothetical protein